MTRHRLLILSLARHDDPHTSTTFQLAKRFVLEHEVMIVENPITWTDAWRKALKSFNFRRLWQALFQGQIVHEDQIRVVIPPAVIPINFLPPGRWYRWVSRLNHRIVARSVNRSLQNEHWGDYHYINSYNYYFPHLTDFLRGTMLRSVYHCVDPIVKDYTKKHGLSNQQQAVEKAQAVISTAPGLQRHWMTTGARSYLVPNAVDFEHFDRPGQEVSSLRGLGSQVVGYFGNIERRIDYDLLTKTFSKRTDWQLVMAGPVDGNYVPDALRALPNAHFSGSYDYELLPDMLRSVDVNLIPFQCDEASHAIYPLKLYEYFSVGKPVVATYFNPEVLDPLADLMYITGPSYDLEQALESALAECDDRRSAQRKQQSAQNTWQHRASSFLHILFDSYETD